MKSVSGEGAEEVCLTVTSDRGLSFVLAPYPEDPIVTPAAPGERPRHFSFWDYPKCPSGQAQSVK